MTYGLLVTTVLGVLAMLVVTFYPTPHIGCDLSLRIQEIRCVLDRVDPYDVWSGAVRHPPYCSYAATPNAETGEVLYVNAYPPWAYTFALPLALLPVPVSGCLYLCFMLATIAALGVSAYVRRRDKGDSRLDALMTAVIPLFLLLPSIGSNFQSYNYPFLVLVATLAMAWCLHRGHDVLAGVCWALAMVKPQIAVIYAIPLLLRRRYLTSAVAAAMCLVAVVPPALCLGRNPVTLIAEGIKGSSAMFIGCGTLPYLASRFLGNGIDVLCGLIIGIVLCLWILVRSAHNADWFVQLGFAAAVSVLWTYSQLYNNVMMWPVFLLMAERFATGNASWRTRTMAVLVAVFMSRAYTFFHGLTTFCPSRFGYSYDWHGHLDSLNSFVCLILLVCFMRTRQGAGTRAEREKPGSA